MKKVLLVFGTRPEAIKMAPLVIELKKQKSLDVKVCITAQHREMLDQVMDVFNIKSDYDLNIMKKGQTLTDITSAVLEGVDEVIQEYIPDIVLVHGDTTTSMAASMAAFYNKKIIGHVEAGLRTYNKYSPYPEEINRQIVDQLADMYFAPTKQSEINLINEGRDKDKIHITGNTVIDAMKYTIDNKFSDDIIDWVGKDNHMILVTTHRRENIGKPMENIFTAINKLTNSFSNLRFVFPMHYNPQVRELAIKFMGNNNKVKLIEPLDVDKFHNYMKQSYLIMTDSGGIQEEAPSLGKPVLVLRNTTERPEGVEAGTLKLVGTDTEDIIYAVSELVKNTDSYNKMSKAINPYGDGTACKKIADVIVKNSI